MSKKIIIVLAVILLAGTVLLYEPGMEVNNVALSSEFDEEDFESIYETSEFTSDDTVYISARIHNPRAGTEVYTEWYDEEGELIHSFEDDPHVWEEDEIGMIFFSRYYDFYFFIGPPTIELSPGDYSVKIILDGEVVESMEFEVI